MDKCEFKGLLESKSEHYRRFLESIAKTLATRDVSVRQPTFKNFGLFANKLRAF